jgi:hypothetical protein
MTVLFKDFVSKIWGNGAYFIQSPTTLKSYFYLEKSKKLNMRFIKLAVITFLTAVKFVYLHIL